MTPTDTPTTADLQAAFRITCPTCAAPADSFCRNGTPYTCPERVEMALAQRWTVAELRTIATLAKCMADLYEGVCEDRTVDTFRGIERKAAQLAFAEISR